MNICKFLRTACPKISYTEQEQSAQEENLSLTHKGRSAWKCSKGALLPRWGTQGCKQQASRKKWQNPFDTRQSITWSFFDDSKVTPKLLGFFFFFSVLGFEVRASCLLGSALPLEPHIQPFLLLGLLLLFGLCTCKAGTLPLEPQL
jgi:hypothetical protein